MDITFDKATSAMIAQEIVALLKPLETKYGVKVSAKGFTYDFNNVVFKTQVAKVVGGEVLNREVQDFYRNYNLYGLRKDDLHKVVSLDGVLYEITGISTSSRKFPICIKRVRDGMTFRYNENDVRKALDARDLAMAKDGEIVTPRKSYLQQIGEKAREEFAKNPPKVTEVTMITPNGTFVHKIGEPAASIPQVKDNPVVLTPENAPKVNLKNF